MSAIQQITGYEKRTERLERALDVPAEWLRDVFAIARVPSADKEALGSYPLDAAAVHLVGLKLGTALNADAYEWYLEPFSAE